jgi:hypothetical protein
VELEHRRSARVHSLVGRLLTEGAADRLLGELFVPVYIDSRSLTTKAVRRKPKKPFAAEYALLAELGLRWN